MHLQFKQSHLYTSAINKHLQTYSHIQNLQNIQQIQLQKHIPNIPNGMCYSTNNTHVNLKQPLRLNNHRIDVNKQNLLQLYIYIYIYIYIYTHTHR